MITIDQWKNYRVRNAFIKNIPHRVQVLLSSIWANNVLHLFEKEYPNDDRPRKAIEIAFDFALTGIVDKNVARAAYASAAYAAYAAAARAAYASAAYAARAAYASAAYAAYAAYASAAYYAAWAASDADATNWTFTYNTYLQSINQIQFNPSWKTEQTIGIAKQIWENKNIGNLPILADALNEAGVEENLTELRNIDQYTTLANWWLWNLNLEINEESNKSSIK